MFHVLNQRTSGPVNAHLTPGPGIYFNAFIHVYSPRAGADNPLGTNVDVNRKPFSLCLFVASFKTISLKYDFKHILNDFIHVYCGPRAGTDNLLGTKFWCQQKFLIILPICCQFKKNLFEVWFFTGFYVFFFHMNIAPGRGRQSTGNKILMRTERPFLFAHMLPISKWSLQISDFKHVFNDFIHVYSPWARAEYPLWTNIWCQRKALITSTIYCKFQTNLFEFWFYTHFLMFFHMYIAPGQGQITLCGQNPDVKRKALSLCPFVASFKKISLKSDFIYSFSCFYTCI